VLHVLNGDALRPGLARAGIAGEVAAFGDMLSEGPVPGVLATLDQWKARAVEVERRFDVPAPQVMAAAQRELAALDEAAKQDEAVLWFEQELFCMANLCFVLHRLRAAPPPRVGLVFPPKPLGQQAWSTLPQLFEGRTDALPLLEDGAAWWEAYAGSDPARFEALAGERRALPFWAGGIRAHLERFPSVRNGLGVQEQVVLEAAGEQVHFGELFQRCADDARMAPQGMGDVGVAATVRDLAAGPKPLLALEDAGSRALRMEEVLHWQVERTPLGDAVAAGEADAVAERGVDRWLGGVHLHGPKPWRWDTAHGRLRPPPA
jgi:hypothetical protein